MRLASSAVRGSAIPFVHTNTGTFDLRPLSGDVVQLEIDELGRARQEMKQA
jgi:hypothetical protein